MRYPWFTLLAACAAGTGLALAQTPLPPATVGPNAVHTNVINAATPLHPEEPAIAKPAPAHPAVPLAEGKDFVVVLETPAQAEAPSPGAVTATSGPQPAQVAAPALPPLAPAVPVQPAPSHPGTGQPAVLPPPAGPTDPHLNPSGEPMSGKPPRPCLRDRIHSLVEKLKCPWPRPTTW